MQTGRRRLAITLRKEAGDIHGVEMPGAIAEFAAHLDFVALAEQRLQLVLAQRLQDAGNALARAAALEPDRRAAKQPDVVFREDSP